MVKIEVSKFNNKIMNYNPDDAYEVDETGPFYRILPGQTLLIEYGHWQKQPNDRVTILLGGNRTGLNKLKPLVIRSSKNSRCF